MLVDYDDSSDEDPKPQKDVKKPVTSTKSQPVTKEPPKKKVTLPSVTSLLNKIPESHLLGAAPKEEEESKRPSLKSDTYNNVRPPTFSLTQEKETQEQVDAKYKRRRPREEGSDDDRDAGKLVKTEKQAKVIDVEEVKKIEKTQKLIPTQLKTKKANIPTLF